MHGPFGDNILVVPNEVHLLPQVAEEPIDLVLTQIVGSVQPIRAKNPHLKLCCVTPIGGVQCVDERSSIVPLKVVHKLPKLVLHDVEVSTVGPVIPEIDYFESAAVIHEENGVELVGPWSWSRVGGFGWRDWEPNAEDEEDEDEDDRCVFGCGGHRGRRLFVDSLSRSLTSGAYGSIWQGFLRVCLESGLCYAEVVLGLFGNAGYFIIICHNSIICIYNKTG